MTNDRNMPDDFRPTASWANLRFRATMLRRLRTFFDEQGFLEVETPILSADTVVDRHLDPFCTDVSPLPLGERPGVRAGQGSGSSAHPSSFIPHPSFSGPHPNPLPKGEGTRDRRMWLQTSPEFAMKRLLAVGAGRIYEVARVFRLDELGPLHNPEFTLVEWYQPGDSMEDGMRLTSDLCETLLKRGGEKGDRHLLCKTPGTNRRLVRQKEPVPFFHPARPNGSATAKRSSDTSASIRMRPMADNWPPLPRSSVSKRRQACRRPIATAGSIC